jgi:hypothetical protein
MISEKMRLLMDELKKLNLPSDEFSVFGSGPMAIRGLKEPGDMDIIVTENLWNKLKQKYELVKKPNYEYLTVNGIDFFHDWTHPGYDLNKLINDSDIIQRVRFVKLEAVLEWKLKRNLEKDKKDIDILKKHLK